MYLVLSAFIIPHYIFLTVGSNEISLQLVGLSLSLPFPLYNGCINAVFSFIFNDIKQNHQNFSFFFPSDQYLLMLQMV